MILFAIYGCPSEVRRTILYTDALIADQASVGHNESTASYPNPVEDPREVRGEVLEAVEVVEASLVVLVALVAVEVVEAPQVALVALVAQEVVEAPQVVLVALEVGVVPREVSLVARGALGVLGHLIDRVNLGWQNTNQNASLRPQHMCWKMGHLTAA